MIKKSIKVELDGNAWCATREGFTNMMECPVGFGETPQEAIDQLIKDEEKAYREF